MINEKDKDFMRECFTLAKRGIGEVSPNPLVGCVIEKDGAIISTGYHKKAGEAHAELNAIENAKESLIGATLYCNLEPCVHTDKKTPPCVPKIIEAGIGKVVVSNIDPNPKVGGKGLTALQENGIEVVDGVLENEGKELNKFFFKHIQTQLPYVTVKIAQSINGKISTSKSEQFWLTGTESQMFVHQQRALYDAVLIGAGTLNVDNPALTVRLVDGRNPKKIIIDGKLSANLTSKIFSNEPEKVIIITSHHADKEKKKMITDFGCKVVELEINSAGFIPLKNILRTVGQLNITSIFVEGGQAIFSQFINEDKFDELIYLVAPKIISPGIDSITFNEVKKYSFSSFEKIGEDVKIVIKN